MIIPIETLRERAIKARERAEKYEDKDLLAVLDAFLDLLGAGTLLTTTQVAQLLGIRSVNTVKALIRAGRIEAQKVGSHYRVSLNEVERLTRDSMIRGLHDASRLHADLSELGLDREMTDDEMQALSASRPGTLPWRRADTPGHPSTKDESDAQRHAV